MQRRKPDFRAKKFFRFLRGELNGFYLHHIAYGINIWAEETLFPALSYMEKVQFNLGSMTEEDLFNIAKYVGVNQLLVKGDLTNNIIHLTSSELVNQVEYSERGLWVKDKEIFEFVRTTQQEYTDDIVTEASSKRQATLVPSGYTPKEGMKYIWFGDEMYDIFGNFLKEKLHDAPPPDDRPYTEYYGPQFLQLAESIIVIRKIPPEALYTVLCIVQRLRYQGSSTQLFAELTETIVGDKVDKGFVKLTKQETIGNHVQWTYENYEQTEAQDKVMRMIIWRNLVEAFFPQVSLVEIVIS